MKYNDLVSVAREFARNAVRLSMTNNVRAKILDAENEIKDLDEALAGTKKNIARANFALSKVDANDPDKDVLTAEYNEQLKDLNERIEDIEKTKAIYAETLKKLNDEIVSIQKGDRKVSMETLQAISTNYLEKLNVDTMLNAAKSVVDDALED